MTTHSTTALMRTNSSARQRHPYQGLLQVVQFNWPQYAAVWVLGLCWLLVDGRIGLPAKVNFAVWMVIALGVFWSVASLLVSHWIYDRSNLYAWQRLDGVFAGPPENWLNLHAGFDEATASLRARFPNSRNTVWDFHDPALMTEPSIARARRLNQHAATVLPVNYASLPAANSTFDCAFLVFAAHELRPRNARERFFAELFRILKPGSCLVLVEHLRDRAGFLAFGPGAFHFFSRREWMRVACSAGFELNNELSITPFVRTFIFGRPI